MKILTTGLSIVNIGFENYIPYFVYNQSKF
jgi:hypothetical protein